MVVYTVQIQRRASRQLPVNGQCPPYFMAEPILQCIYITFYDWVNNCGNYGDGFYNFMKNDKDSHTPSELIMFTSTTLHHAPLDRQ